MQRRLEFVPESHTDFVFIVDPPLTAGQWALVLAGVAGLLALGW